MKIKKKIKQIMAYALALAMLCGVLPSNAAISSAATQKSVSLASHMWLEWQSKQRDLVCEYEENIVGYDVIFDSDKNIER